MSHDEPMRIRDLPTRQIEAALKLTGADISFTQLLAIESFLEQIGGIDNARLGDTLRKIESQPSADHDAEEDEIEQVEFVFEEDEIDDDEDEDAA